MLLILMIKQNIYGPEKDRDDMIHEAAELYDVAMVRPLASPTNHLRVLPEGDYSMPPSIPMLDLFLLATIGMGSDLFGIRRVLKDLLMLHSAQQ